MAYTEVKERKHKNYYYRVISIRNGRKISKIRKYLGVNLLKEDLSLKEKMADKEFGLLYKDRKMKRLDSIKKRIIRVLVENNIRRAGIFGSFARGEDTKGSDIDILIEPPKDMGFKFAGLEMKLTRALKKKVDLVSYNGISPYIKDKILKQEIRIL